jgi:hypothetical protein
MKIDLTGMNCLIVFVDRFHAGSYKYYPIRKAKVISTFTKDNRFFIKCSFGDYCIVENYDDFTNDLKQTVDGVPELVRDDPNNINDGYYVQVGKGINNIICGNNYWWKIADEISKTSQLHKDHMPFVKITISSESLGLDEVLPKQSDIITIESEEVYKINIFYYDPEKGSNDKTILLKLKQPLICLESEQINIGALTDNISKSFESGSAFTLRNIRSSIEIGVFCKEKNLYTLNLPIQVSSQLLVSYILFWAAILVGVIILHEYMEPRSFLSTITEVLKWIIGFKIYLTFGKKPDIPKLS